MYKYFFLLLLACPYSSKAQSELKIYFENTDSGIDVLVDNPQPITQSAKIDFQLMNLKNEKSPDFIYLIPAKVQKFLLTRLKIINSGKSSKATSKVIFNFGNHQEKEYDKNFIYHLPFCKGKSYKISQGYNGRFSHQGENALDFDLNEGDEVWAARGGIVFQIVENHSQHCTNPSCVQYNNYISIVHEDGTIGEYNHLKKNGAIVEIGDTVNQDQLIGYSGNTGYTDGPHLHFEVFLQRLNSKESVKTLFRVGDTEKPIFLEEKKTYLRNY